MNRFLPQAAHLCLVLLFPLTAPAFDLEERTIEFTLDNGMQFLLVPREGAPVVNCTIRFRVGGVDENIGSSGAAHMLEHMAFKGTRHIGTRDFEAERPLLEEIERLGDLMRAEKAKGRAADPRAIAELRSRIAQLQEQANEHVIGDELWDTYLRNGAGDLNASTSKDTTTYYVSLPANRLELWALIESQRMTEPVFREFYSERDVVAEERRMRTDTRPWGKLYETLLAAAFQAHPNRLPIIGWMSDIQSLSLHQVRGFWDLYYGPNNCVAAVVGNFDPETVRALAEKYFAPIPARPAPPGVLTEEPEQKGERRVQVLFDAEPQVLMGYKRPTIPSATADILDLVHVILTEGRTSRLHRRLVQEDRIAASVYSFDAPGERYDNLFVLGAVPLAGHSTDRIEAVLYEELARLASEGPTREELDRARNRRRVEFIRDLQTNDGLAKQLTYYAVVAGDWRYLVRYLERVRDVTVDDVRAVAATVFVPETRTVAVLESTRGEKS